MQIVPIQPVAQQTLAVVLAEQNCQIVISQRSTGLFLDLYSNGSLVIAGVICENLNRIVRSSYLGFTGDLAFVDTQGTSDPVYTGLGSRYLLAYIEASELT
jgi:hypothetical protein